MRLHAVNPKVIVPGAPGAYGRVTPELVVKLQTRYVHRIAETVLSSEHMSDSARGQIANNLRRGIYVGDPKIQPVQSGASVAALANYVYSSELAFAGLKPISSVQVEDVEKYILETQERMRLRTLFHVPKDEDSLIYPDLALYVSFLESILTDEPYDICYVSDDVGSKELNDLHRIGYVALRVPVLPSRDKLKYERTRAITYDPPSLTMKDLVQATNVMRHITKPMARMAADFIDVVYSELTRRYEMSGEDIEKLVLDSIDGIAGYDLTRLILNEDRANILVSKIMSLFKALYFTWSRKYGEQDATGLSAQIIDDFVMRLDDYAERETTEEAGQSFVMLGDFVDPFPEESRKMIRNLNRIRDWLEGQDKSAWPRFD